jgi:hypothetical protein
MKPVPCASRSHALLLYVCLTFAIGKTGNVPTIKSTSIPDQDFHRRFPRCHFEWQSLSHTAPEFLHQTAPDRHLYLRGGGSRPDLRQKGKKPHKAPSFVSGGVLKGRGKGAPRRSSNKNKASTKPATQPKRKKKQTTKPKPKPGSMMMEDEDMDIRKVERKVPHHKVWRQVPPAKIEDDDGGEWSSDFVHERTPLRTTKESENEAKLKEEVERGGELLKNMHEILRGINHEEIAHVFEHTDNVDAKASEILDKFQQNFARFGLKKLENLLPKEDEIVVSQEEEDSTTKSGEDDLEVDVTST